MVGLAFGVCKHLKITRNSLNEKQGINVKENMPIQKIMSYNLKCCIKERSPDLH
jgi:hypothetical protein